MPPSVKPQRCGAFHAHRGLRATALVAAPVLLLYGGCVFALDLSLDIRASLDAPTSGFQASRSADALQWFDESSRNLILPEIKLRLGLPDRSGLGVALGQLAGEQRGKIGKYECVFLGCAWMPSKLITGIEASESVAWRFTRLASWYEHGMSIAGLNARLRAGLNLTYGEMSAHAANETWRIQGLVPSPAVGLSLCVPLAQDWTIEGHYDRSALHIAGGKLDTEESRIELRHQWHPRLTATLGYGRHRLDLGYARNDTQAALAVNISAPFIGMTYHFN